MTVSSTANQIRYTGGGIMHALKYHCAMPWTRYRASPYLAAVDLDEGWA